MVHPHGRGDGDVQPCQSLRHRGSPPRAWGRRLVPSGAGQISTVHPHGRGDGVGHRRIRQPFLGSPPRAWGRRRTRRASPTPTTVHPHGRGDGWGDAPGSRQSPRFTPTGVGTAITENGDEHAFLGSPPRAWGRLVHNRGEDNRQSVHPHGRGDGVLLLSQHNDRRGSPPRAWGRRVFRGRCCWVSFGSPPRAWGRRIEMFPRRPQTKVHPHGRGDG